MKTIKQLILAIGIIAGLSLASAPLANAANIFDNVCSGSNTALCQNKNDNVQSQIATIVNVLLYVLGAVSVIVIIIAGIMYVTSGGDAAAVTKAKNTLMYAIVGLIVAVLAYAIVNFVVSKFGK
jgi:uncharacterized membrane protein